MARTKNTTPLDQRVCKRGHVGKYIARANSNPACTECEWLKRKAIQDAVRALTPSKREIPLNERVCKRGHVGKYVERANSVPACTDCLKIAVAKYKVKADAVRVILYGTLPKAPAKACGCACGCGGA